VNEQLGLFSDLKSGVELPVKRGFWVVHKLLGEHIPPPHNGTRLPVVLAGSLGGTLQTGRSVDYLNAGNAKRKLCALYLAIMDRMGLKLPEFGDAREQLAGI